MPRPPFNVTLAFRCAGFVVSAIGVSDGRFATAVEMLKTTSICVTIVNLMDVTGMILLSPAASLLLALPQ